MIGIYLIWDKTKSKGYVGKSISIENRWCQHLNQAKNALKFDDEFHFELNQRPSDFEFSILEICQEEELPALEKDYISIYETDTKGYNIIAASKVNNFVHKKEAHPSDKEISEKLNLILGLPLTKEDKDNLVDFFNIYEGGRQKKWNTIKKLLVKKGFAVIDTKRRIRGRITNCSIISVDWSE